MVIFHSYVSLPEGNSGDCNGNQQHLWMIDLWKRQRSVAMWTCWRIWRWWSMGPPIQLLSNDCQQKWQSEMVLWAPTFVGNECYLWIYTVFISAIEEVWLDHSKNTEHRSMIYSHSASTPWFKERLLVPKAPKNPTCFVTKSPRNCLPNRHIEKNFSSAASDSTKLRWLLGTTKRPDLAVDGCR